MIKIRKGCVTLRVAEDELKSYLADGYVEVKPLQIVTVLNPSKSRDLEDEEIPVKKPVTKKNAAKKKK